MNVTTYILMESRAPVHVNIMITERNMEKNKRTNIMMKGLSCSSHAESVCTVHLAASLMEPISQKSQAEMQIW